MENCGSVIVPAFTCALQFGHGGEPWRTQSRMPSEVSDFALQFGHGGEPWRTTRAVQTPSSRYLLQFGHGGEPWRTPRCTSAAGRTLSFNSATAVNRGELRDAVLPVLSRHGLQFGHGGEPWRTVPGALAPNVDCMLQFGHGGEPWRTRQYRGGAVGRIASIRPRR